jgi:hypothetical protein
MQKKLINKIGIWTAALSFLIGTLLLFVFYAICLGWAILAGYFFTITAGIINAGILLVLIFKALKDKKNRKSYLKTSAIILINIPVAIAYFYFVIMLLNTMRITFINDTGKTLTEAEIISTQNSKAGNFNEGESKTVWMNITGDCAIYIKYNMNSKVYKDVVCPYVCRNSGGKITYRIARKFSDWPEAANGLQAKISLKQTKVINGTGIVTTYLTLKNVSDVGNPMKIEWNKVKIKFQVIDKNGKNIPKVAEGVYDGRDCSIEHIILPHDSELTFNISKKGLGISKDKAALLDFGSRNCWVIDKADKKYFLKITLAIAIKFFGKSECY